MKIETPLQLVKASKLESPRYLDETMQLLARLTDFDMSATYIEHEEDGLLTCQVCLRIDRMGVTQRTRTYFSREDAAADFQAFMKYTRRWHAIEEFRAPVVFFGGFITVVATTAGVASASTTAGTIGWIFACLTVFTAGRLLLFERN